MKRKQREKRDQRKQKANEIIDAYPDGIMLDDVITKVRVARKSGFLVGTYDRSIRIDPLELNFF